MIIGSLPDDVSDALDRAGLRACRVSLLKVTPDPVRPRSLFRVELDSGTTVKVRRLESEKAARKQQELRALMPSAFAPVLARSGAVLIEAWIDGRLLTDATPTEPLVREAGRLLADLHAIPRACGKSLPYYKSTSDLKNYMESRLNRLQAAGALDAATVEALCSALEANAPDKAQCGVMHQDFCGENMVVDRAGGLHVVDNEHTTLDAFALDIARTWYRWALRDEAWGWFCDAYKKAGGSDETFTHALFWRIIGVTLSAWIRLISSHTELDVPLRCLRLLASEHKRRIRLS